MFKHVFQFLFQKQILFQKQFQKQFLFQKQNKKKKLLNKNMLKSKWLTIIVLAVILITKSLVNSKTACYLPNGCRFLDDTYNNGYKVVKIYCIDFHAQFDYEMFNKS